MKTDPSTHANDLFALSELKGGGIQKNYPGRPEPSEIGWDW